MSDVGAFNARTIRSSATITIESAGGSKVRHSSCCTPPERELANLASTR